MKKYILSINSNNLGEYFSRAIIIPQKYFEDPIKDLQSIYPSYLMFTSEKFSEESDCSIEVILNDNEISKLEKYDNYELLPSAIPITRVSKIIFYSQEKMERTIDLARSSSFIPEKLISVIDKNESDFLNEIPLKNDSIPSGLEILENIDLFNRYLGGFAFMRLGGENYMNYSENYFTTLNYFNLDIDKEILPVKSKLNLDIKFHSLFENKEKSWKDLHSHIFGSSKNIISYIDNKIPLKNNKYQIEIIKNNSKNLYVLGVLANYGPEQYKPSTTDSLLQALISDSILYREAITLFFGLHNGYRNFSNLYTLNNTKQIVKFQLESKLDYYTIESIYQFVFNKKKSVKFDYLNTVIPNNSKKIDNKKYYTYQILDEHIIYKTKPETVKEIISNYFKKTKFFKILVELSNDFQKKNNIKFTIEQSEKFNADIYDIIKTPLQFYFEDIEKEISDHFTNSVSVYTDKIQQLENSIKINKQEHYQLSLLLKNIDTNLFEEIDTNGNGILDSEELLVFLDKMNKAKEKLRELNEQPFNDEIVKTNQNSIETLYIETKPELFTSTNNDIAIHKYYLNKLGLSELNKEIKKHLDITEKVNKDNKESFIEKILKAIDSGKLL